MSSHHLPMYIIDSFTDKPFSGNPASVCLMGNLVFTDDQYLLISREMNHSETAFIGLRSDDNNYSFNLRWFTPTNEVNLCGHGTLAAAHVLFNEEKLDASEIHFHTLSGVLVVKKTDEGLQMKFPLGNPSDVKLDDITTKEMANAFNICHESVIHTSFCPKTNKLIVELKDPNDVLSASIPSSSSLKDIQWPCNVRGISLTSEVKDSSSFDGCDFMSRYFSPWNGIPEDPVNGSSHTVLPLYYQKRFPNKKILKAYAASKRSGILWLEIKDENSVYISGVASTVLKGEINISRLI